MNDLLFSDYGIEVRIREFLRAHQSEKDTHAVLLSVQKKNDEVDRELRDSK
jgi:hypothetical protein